MPGYLVGEAGILLVAQLLEPAAETADLLERAIRRNAGNETNELLWGAPGTMLAALAMHGSTAEQRWADAWRHQRRRAVGAVAPCPRAEVPPLDAAAVRRD